MGSRGASARKPKDMTGTASATDLIETVPALVPKNIIRLKNPLEFGAAYADYYKTARGGNDSKRLASSAVSTWIAKHDYESNEGTADNESKVYIGAMRAIKK
jgi:hypothetical protein